MVAILDELCPLFFALDKCNYSRWLPVHIRDLQTLPPSIHQEFLQGNFTIPKTTAKFSAIAIDRAHEQGNATFKGDGDAVGLTENLVAFGRRWLLPGPPDDLVVRIISKFENCFLTSNDDFESTDHHEHGKHTQFPSTGDELD
eukprot:Pompholyxophrys_punicea_v1_NODE_72_length_3753_cov_12.732558.p1 type:complete len:143 gc:universal NODE_72_length_3753_cov_12.732558:734-1162(+)